MPIDVFGLYEDLCGSVNTQQGGHARPNRNFLQWVNSISLSLFEEKFAAWSKSQKIIDDLSRPFLKSINLQVKPVSGNYGVAQFPVNYGHYSSARYFHTDEKKETSVPLNELDFYDCCGELIKEDSDCPEFLDPELWAVIQSEKKAKEPKSNKPSLIEVPIDSVGNDRWGSVMGHRFNGPTMANPKITQFDGGFKVAPAEVTWIILDYLRMPEPATFKYSVAPGDPLTGSGDYLVYDSTSQPLEWSMLVKNEFLTRLDKKYGKYIREDFIYHTSEADRKAEI